MPSYQLNFNIRKAFPEDLPDLSKMFDAYRVFYEKSSDPSGAEIFLKERMDKQESELFVAESEIGDLVGFTQLYPLFSSTRMKRLWLLNDLFVAPEYRGKGISIQLIDAAKRLCIETNACGLILETANSNIIGNSLYPKTGFHLDTDHHCYYWDSYYAEQSF
jgi:GNAT superfamily N-acetyltransferase